MRKALILLALLAAACGKPADPTATASTEGAAPGRAASSDDPAVPPRPLPFDADNPAAAAFAAGAPLPGKLNCLRDSREAALLIGHRGGPTRDYPENAVETFQRTLNAGVRGMEIDIASTKDGVLFLMHDDELDRLTTAKGLVADKTWDEIKGLKLRTSSKTTDFHPAKLEDALKWAVANNALLELDKKQSASFDPIIAAIRAAGAENNVFIITYTDAQAIEVHAKAPDLVITATVKSDQHLDFLLAKGVKADYLVAWTGTADPDDALWGTLANRNVESAFGTLGPRSTSLDTKYFADNDGSEFSRLVDDGLDILVTDLTDKVSRQLKPNIAAARRCGF